MNAEKQQAFLDRSTYRRRRIADAARLLPIFGSVLLLVPLLWGGPRGQTVPTSYVMVYLFVVWFGLIGVSTLVSRRLNLTDDSTDTRKEE
ncbi:hypothetical protein EI983_09375 [Roseovarius faecimaris]|uniref:Uncharacterized protein n=1 Tax=Roseovarius faecimaris TaxID=2494550 RepID=A0A6I6IMZ0_9RHOB|nr:hypothetical protein [Roseovarius faecimaris]QGX98480.1 hypothetical protein EI983_09375 [Roseovarius faecimaris]